MTIPEVTSAEDLTESGTVRGRLSQVSLPQILSHLQNSKQTGVLSLVNAGVHKSIYFKEGKVVFAASSLTQDRMGEVLLRGAKISADEYLRLENHIRGGQRLGKALVESGVLSPKDLWWAIEQQVQETVWSLFSWEDGYFHFEDDDRPNREKITVDLEIDALIVEGIRRIDGSGPIREHYVPVDSVLVKTGKALPLEPESHEKHVLDLVDGTRTVSEVCGESEIGEAETRKVFHAFFSVGILGTKSGEEAPIEEEAEEADEDYAAMIELYNNMYRYLFRHMSGEVGPIAEIILEKYLNELKDRPSFLFERVRLQRDGSLDARELEKNVLELLEGDKKNALVEALNELLYAELLAVKRTLGASHESQLIQVFRKMRGDE
jgi:hypothetical protein